MAAAHGGRACAGPREESRACNTKACPIDCKYAEWGDWETCSATCGNGTRVHKREVEVEAQHGGGLSVAFAMWIQGKNAKEKLRRTAPARC